MWASPPWWHWVVMAAVWLGVVGAAVWAASQLAAGPRTRRDALAILDERLARGELSLDDYRQCRGELER